MIYDNFIDMKRLYQDNIFFNTILYDVKILFSYEVEFFFKIKYLYSLGITQLCKCLHVF